MNTSLQQLYIPCNAVISYYISWSDICYLITIQTLLFSYFYCKADSILLYWKQINSIFNVFWWKFTVKCLKSTKKVENSQKSYFNQILGANSTPKMIEIHITQLLRHKSFSKVWPYALPHAPNFMKLTPGQFIVPCR